MASGTCSIREERELALKIETPSVKEEILILLQQVLLYYSELFLLYLTPDICAESHQQISWWFCMGVWDLWQTEKTCIDNSFLSISLRILSIKINTMIFMLLRLRLKDIQDCNVLQTFAFGLEERKNNCREDTWKCRSRSCSFTS